MNVFRCLQAAVICVFAMCADPLQADEAAPSFASNAPLKEISPDTYQFGNVVLNKKERTVEFPAQINMREGLIEYLIVTTKGKTHESLLKTDTEPQHIHIAMLLLGAKGAPQLSALSNAPSQQFFSAQAGKTNPIYANLSRGDPIFIELSWHGSDSEKHTRAEDCVFDLETKKNTSPGPWSYNGSRVVNGLFLAQRDGSIVAMIDDVDAMANNPRPGHDNDQIWQINTNGLPPVNTPVQVKFKLETKVNK